MRLLTAKLQSTTNMKNGNSLSSELIQKSLSTDFQMESCSTWFILLARKVSREIRHR
jgi:hypothetical protein